jgi:hypothetical protein
MSSPPEKKLAEGIYITDFRKPQTQSTTQPAEDELGINYFTARKYFLLFPCSLAPFRSFKNQHPSVIQHEINRINNSRMLKIYPYFLASFLVSRIVAVSHLLRSNKELQDALKVRK